MQVPAQPAYHQVSPDLSEEDDSDPDVILEDSLDNLESDSEQDWTTLCGDDPDAQIRPPTMEEPNTTMITVQLRAYNNTQYTGYYTQYAGYYTQ